jgi:DNA adenine methylase
MQYSAVRPFVLWAGGKRQMLHHINSMMPDLKGMHYIEPFVGGGAVLFYAVSAAYCLARGPYSIFIGDLNNELINAYACIKLRVAALINLLKIHAVKDSQEYFYELRDLERDKEEWRLVSPIERAARFIYMNKKCYKGLYRVNSKGYFNTPYYHNGKRTICDEENLLAINKYFNTINIKIFNCDYEALLFEADEKTFCYLDPPYHSENGRGFTSYNAAGFGVSAQTRLKRNCDNLTRKGAKWLLSNADNEFIRDLFKDYTILSFIADRNINTNSAGRRNHQELLIKNY